jgi:O-antigen/teichoic acid export membrane protein
MSNYKVIIRNIFSNWLNSLVAIAIGFFMMPFMVSHLGDEMYGIWILIMSFVGYGSLLDMGIKNSIIKYVAQYNVKGDKEDLNRIFSTSLLVYTVMGVVVVAIAVLVSRGMSHMFNINPLFRQDAQMVVLVAGLELALSLPFGVFGGFLAGLQRYDTRNGIVIVTSIVRSALILVFLWKGYHLVALSVIMLFSDVLGHVGSIYFMYKYLPDLKMDFKGVDGKTFRDIFSYGLYSMLNAISLRLKYRTNPIIIGAYLGAGSITFYSIADNLMRYLRQISYGFSYVFNPVASELEAKEEHERIRRLVIYGAKYSLLIILPISLAFIFLGREFISIWIGSKYAPLAGTVLIILAASHIVALSQETAGSILFGLNKHRYSSLLVLIESICNVALSIVLVRKYGVVGVALGAAIPQIVVNSIFLPLYITKVSGLTALRYIREAFYPHLISATPAVAVIYLYGVYVRPASWASLIIGISVSTAVYAVISIFSCFDAGQRVRIIEAATSNLRKRVLSPKKA